ncbi:SCO family protein [Cyclobacterium marinum]|uniref:Electron transport protein SCO1/SenC n=1 Tax=Cyclobacterium marinum (strain ATCC 25205 / DSM 745 / LMG 13164 / NCIMB 1802) TaxID=880070 RepID=G0IZH6_CYCMS|nr:SCO family protein [Cyclobacterium marinum]AEL25017.1 electron transport protein SCO1/SenC [Cyclobacterium marinum DSM 745]
MNKLLIILIVGFAIACNANKQQSEVEASSRLKLPYYEESTFTPRWFTGEEEVPENFHEIPQFQVYNQLGDTVTADVFDDKITIVNFFFTTCPGICPKMMANMELVQEELSEDKGVQLLSYSVTPDMDGVPELQAYAKKNGISSENWYLLTGERQDIYDLGRNQFFVEEDMGIQKSPDDFLHTENILLIDNERHIRGIYNGLNKTAIKQLMADAKLLRDELIVL